jgi:DNA-binding MarR family transcriptional regulator
MSAVTADGGGIASLEPRAGLPCGGALSEDLGWALGVVLRSYLKAANAVFRDLPGGPRGYQVLAAATRGEPGSQLALAQHLGVDRTVMTYLIDDLEAAGLVARRPDPADRRARRIVPTEHGSGLLADLDRRLRAAEDHVLGDLSDADAAAFRVLLQRVATHANALDPAGSACEIAQEINATVAPSGQASRTGRTPRRR